jgi:hypothetical protein
MTFHHAGAERAAVYATFASLGPDLRPRLHPMLDIGVGVMRRWLRSSDRMMSLIEGFTGAERFDLRVSFDRCF